MLKYVADILNHGDVTRDYGVRQEQAKIEQNSGEPASKLNGIMLDTLILSSRTLLSIVNILLMSSSVFFRF